MHHSSIFIQIVGLWLGPGHTLVTHRSLGVPKNEEIFDELLCIRCVYLAARAAPRGVLVDEYCRCSGGGLGAVAEHTRTHQAAGLSGAGFQYHGLWREAGRLGCYGGPP